MIRFFWWLVKNVVTLQKKIMTNKEAFLKLVSEEKTDTIKRNRLRIRYRWLIRIINRIKIRYYSLNTKWK